MWRNTEQRYGYLSIIFHWLIALMVLSLFGVGLWMVSLDYYHPWYHQAPFWHKSFGITLLLLVMLRMAWRVFSIRPKPLSTMNPLVLFFILVTHLLMYVLLMAIPVTGILLSGSDGDVISLFGWLDIPVLIEVNNQDDFWSDAHEWLAWGLIVLVAGHVLAACWHHWVKKDKTLLRMLGK